MSQRCSVLLVGLALASCGGGLGGTATPVAGAGGRGGAPSGAGGISIVTGGTGGSFGSMGSAGTAPSSVAGTFGNNACAIFPSPTNCGGGLCGNGVRDTCVIRAAFDTCPEVQFTEVCDGTDPSGEGCRALGFGGGTLACSNFCQNADASGCRECADLDAHLLSCGPAPLSVFPFAVAIAATDTEVAIAWLELDPNDDSTILGFARLTPELTVVSSTRTADRELMFASNLLVAPLPSGWVVAGINGDVYVHAFDASGRHLSRTRVDTVPNGWLDGPLLASRPGGGPLLVWMTETAIRAALISENGRSATAPFDVATTDIFGSPIKAAYVGNVFYVANAVQRPGNDGQLRVRRIETDGRVAAAFDALPGVTAYDPQLVPGAGELRVIYTGSQPTAPGTDPGDALWLQRVAPTGAAAGAPVVLVGAPDSFSFGRGVAFGNDTALLVFGSAPLNSIRVGRLASDGSFAIPLRKIAGGDSLYPTGSETIVRRGPDAVALWVSTTGTIQLARLVL